MVLLVYLKADCSKQLAAGELSVVISLASLRTRIFLVAVKCSFHALL